MWGLACSVCPLLLTLHCTAGLQGVLEGCDGAGRHAREPLHGLPLPPCDERASEDAAGSACMACVRPAGDRRRRYRCLLASLFCSASSRSCCPKQTPGGPSVASGAQAAAAQGAGRGGDGHQAAPAEPAGGGGNRGERRQAGAEIQLPPALVKARGRVQAVQAAGPLPSVVGMQTTGTPQHAGDQSGWEGVALDAAVAFVFSCAWSDEQRAANAPC